MEASYGDMSNSNTRMNKTHASGVTQQATGQSGVRSYSSNRNTFKESIKESLHSAIGGVWGEIVEQLKKEMYVVFGGYDCSELCVVEGGSGESLLTIKLSDIVTIFIDDQDKTCGTEQLERCDSIAADLEKQAKRIRKRVDKLRRSNSANE